MCSFRDFHCSSKPIQENDPENTCRDVPEVRGDTGLQAALKHPDTIYSYLKTILASRY